MNKPELLTILRDIREYYRAALEYQVEGKTDAAISRLTDADETILPLIEAVEQDKLIFRGSMVKIEGDTVGERLRFIRKSQGVTQHDLLKVLGRPKTDQSWYSRIEDGEKRISVVDLKKIAFFFGVLVDDLIP